VLNVHDLIIDHLKEKGFPTEKWNYRFIWDGHRYEVFPGITSLKIYDDGRISLGPLFALKTKIEDPESIDNLIKHLEELYSWLERIGVPMVR
jgi:hypothetical protein